MSWITIAAFALLVLGVVASLRLAVPGAVLSLAGVYTYWWGTDFSEPATLTLVLVSAVGVLAIAGQAYARFVAKRIRGASRTVAVIAGLVGAVGFLFTGTTGFLTGVVVTVFFLEYFRRRSLRGGFTAIVAVVFGSIASKLLQFLLTGAILVVMVDAVLL